MILTFLLQILDLLLTGVVNLLPNATSLPSNINDAFQYFLTTASQWTFIFPLSTVFTILGFTLLIELSLWTFHGGVWIYNKIRGI